MDDGFYNVTDNARYIISRKVDVRYPKMDPIMCFELKEPVTSTNYFAEITQVKDFRLFHYFILFISLFLYFFIYSLIYLFIYIFIYLFICLFIS